MQEVRCKDSQSPRNQARYRNARVAKLVDARDLKSLSCEAMRVRPPPRAQIKPRLRTHDQRCDAKTVVMTTARSTKRRALPTLQALADMHRKRQQLPCY